MTNQQIVQKYFKKAMITSPKISHCGNYVCYVRQHDQSSQIVLVSLSDGNERMLAKGITDNIFMHGFSSDDKRILFSKDEDGNENYRLYYLQQDIDDYHCITPFDHVLVSQVNLSKRQPNVIGFTMNKDNPASFDYYTYNFDTQSLDKVVDNDGAILSYLVDDDFTVKVRLRKSGENSYIEYSEVGFKDAVSTDFAPVDHFLIEDGFTSALVALDKSNDDIYYTKYKDNGPLSLYRYDQQRQVAEMIYHNPKYDVEGVLLNHHTKRPLAVAIQAFYNDYQQLSDDTLPYLDICKRDFIDDYFVLGQTDQRWLIQNVETTGKISYYTLDDNGITLFGDAKPWLQDDDLFVHEAYAYTARDGLAIEGYLTYPRGEKINLPLVLSVHGGPWWRDSVQYITEETTWLAQMGFAVLNVNFRGSTGYGLQFLDAGNKEWGRKMLTDLVDAVQPLIDKGVVDANRVGIFGMSYGGYAVLSALCFEPEFFKFGVDRVGPSDIKALLDQLPPHWGPMTNHYYKRMGHPEHDVEFLKSISPLFHADKIVSPLMIAQGLNDPRVKHTESEKMVAAMKKRGVEVEYLLFKDEGHILVKQENIFHFYERSMAFLEKFVR